MPNKILLAVLLIGILLPTFCIGQTLLPNSRTVGPPQTMEGVKTVFWKALKFFPEIIIKVAKDTFDWLKGIWNTYIYPFLHGIWTKIGPIFGQEVQRRKPIIKQEMKQQTQEMKNEVPLISQSLWQKIKDFFKFK